MGCSCFVGAWRWWSSRSSPDPKSREPTSQRSPAQSTSQATEAKCSAAAQRAAINTSPDQAALRKGADVSAQQASQKTVPARQDLQSPGHSSQSASTHPTGNSAPVSEARPSSTEMKPERRKAIVDDGTSPLAQHSPSQAGAKRRTTEPEEDPDPAVESNKRPRAAAEEAGDGKPCEPCCSISPLQRSLLAPTNSLWHTACCMQACHD